MKSLTLNLKNPASLKERLELNVLDNKITLYCSNEFNYLTTWIFEKIFLANITKNRIVYFRIKKVTL
jgi:hypothetical protein